MVRNISNMPHLVREVLYTEQWYFIKLVYEAVANGSRFFCGNKEKNIVFDGMK